MPSQYRRMQCATLGAGDLIEANAQVRLAYNDAQVNILPRSNSLRAQPVAVDLSNGVLVNYGTVGEIMSRLEAFKNSRGYDDRMTFSCVIVARPEFAQTADLLLQVANPQREIGRSNLFDNQVVDFRGAQPGALARRLAAPRGQLAGSIHNKGGRGAGRGARSGGRGQQGTPLGTTQEEGEQGGAAEGSGKAQQQQDGRRNWQKRRERQKRREYGQRKGKGRKPVVRHPHWDGQNADQTAGEFFDEQLADARSDGEYRDHDSDDFSSSFDSDEESPSESEERGPAEGEPVEGEPVEGEPTEGEPSDQDMSSIDVDFEIQASPQNESRHELRNMVHGYDASVAGSQAAYSHHGGQTVAYSHYGGQEEDIVEL